MILIVKTKEEVAEVYKDEELIAKFKQESWVKTLKEAKTYCNNLNIV